MSFQPRPNHPYAHAPRLPEGDTVELATLLPGDGPIELEIGPGRGSFIFERCEAAPESRILGLEIRLKWATIVDGRLRKRGFGHRARVLADDAKLAMARLSPSGSVARVFMHFPDPWWKKRHAKRLVMGDVFLDGVARLLGDGGELFVQTDVEERAEQYRAAIDAYPLLEPFGDEPDSPVMQDNPYGARSNREHRAIEDGLPVYRLRYRRVARD